MMHTQVFRVLRAAIAVCALVLLLPALPTSGVAQENAATPEGAALEVLWVSAGGPDPLARPYGLGVAPDGTLWVADGQNSRFQIIAPDGAYLESWGTPGSGDGEFNFATLVAGSPAGYGDVAFDAAGNIYVADSGNRRIQKFGPDRTFLLAWGSPGTADGQFLAPSGIAVAADGTVYVSDEQRPEVQRFSSTGEFLGTIGAYGDEEGQMILPTGVAVDAEDTVWVSDYTLNRVQRFTPEGELLAAWGVSGDDAGELQNPNGVAVDAAGRVYIWDGSNLRLQVFTAEGEYLAQIGGAGSGPGQFEGAAGIAVGSDGTVYVSDAFRDDVQAFRLMLPERDA